MKLGDFISIEGGIGDYELKHSKYLIITEKENDSWKQTLINPVNHSVLWSSEEQERIKYCGNSFYVINKQTVSKRKENTGNIIWEYFYNIAGFQPINLYANKDFCLIGLLNKDLLICIDNNTGNEIWRQKSIPRGLIIDKSKNVVHQLMVNYIQLKLETGEIIKSKIDREYFQDIKIENQKDNLLLFENSIIANDSKTKRTGKLNLDKLEFNCWIDGISVPEGYKMKSNNDTIFLLGLDKTLNIINMKAR